MGISTPLTSHEEMKGKRQVRETSLFIQSIICQNFDASDQNFFFIEMPNIWKPNAVSQYANFNVDLPSYREGETC